MRSLLPGFLIAVSAVAAVHDVRDYGARGEGAVKDTTAIQEAIDAAHGKGGGVVRFGPGRYLSGTVRLRSRVTLDLEPGAVLVASTDNAGVAGVIDGNRQKRGGPKPIAIKTSRHIAIRDISVRNAPNYAVSFLGCDYVVVDGVTVLNGYSDGIDPDCSRYVRISNCFVDSWDDAVCLKASRALGARRSTEDVVVTNCNLSSSSNAFKLGTESSGDFRNITFSNSTIFRREARDRTQKRY